MAESSEKDGNMSKGIGSMECSSGSGGGGYADSDEQRAKLTGVTNWDRSTATVVVDSWGWTSDVCAGLVMECDPLFCGV